MVAQQTANETPVSQDRSHPLLAILPRADTQSGPTQTASKSSRPIRTGGKHFAVGVGAVAAALVERFCLHPAGASREVASTVRRHLIDQQE